MAISVTSLNEMSRPRQHAEDKKEIVKCMAPCIIGTFTTLLSA